MTLPQSSPNHPFTFAKTLMKTEISWEYINNSDVKNALMPRTKEEAPSVEGMEKSLAEKGVNFNRILPDKSVSYRLGEEIPPIHAKKILIVTTWRSGFDQPSPICGISYARSEYYRVRFCGSLVLAHLPKSSFRSCTQAKLIRTEVALAMRTALSVIKSLVSSPDKIVLIVRR